MVEATPCPAGNAAWDYAYPYLNVAGFNELGHWNNANSGNDQIRVWLRP